MIARTFEETWVSQRFCEQRDFVSCVSSSSIHHPSSIIIHHSSFIIHHSSFIILSLGYRHYVSPLSLLLIRLLLALPISPIYSHSLPHSRSITSTIFIIYIL